MKNVSDILSSLGSFGKLGGKKKKEPMRLERHDANYLLLDEYRTDYGISWKKNKDSGLKKEGIDLSSYEKRRVEHLRDFIDESYDREKSIAKFIEFALKTKYKYIQAIFNNEYDYNTCRSLGDFAIQLEGYMAYMLTSRQEFHLFDFRMDPSNEFMPKSPFPTDNQSDLVVFDNIATTPVQMQIGLACDLSIYCPHRNPHVFFNISTKDLEDRELFKDETLSFYKPYRFKFLHFYIENAVREGKTFEEYMSEGIKSL